MRSGLPAVSRERYPSGALWVGRGGGDSAQVCPGWGQGWGQRTGFVPQMPPALPLCPGTGAGAPAQVTPGTPSSLRPQGAQLLRGAEQGPPQGPRAAAPSRMRARISWAPSLRCPLPSVPLPRPRPFSGPGRPSAHTSCLPHSACVGPSHRGQGLRLASEQEGGGPLPRDQALKGRPPQAGAPPRPVLLARRWQRERWSLTPRGRRAGSWLAGYPPAVRRRFVLTVSGAALRPLVTPRWLAACPQRLCPLMGPEPASGRGLQGRDAGPALPGPRRLLATFASFRTPCWLCSRRRIRTLWA